MPEIRWTKGGRQFVAIYDTFTGVGVATYHKIGGEDTPIAFPKVFRVLYEEFRYVSGAGGTVVQQPEWGPTDAFDATNRLSKLTSTGARVIEESEAVRRAPNGTLWAKPLVDGGVAGVVYFEVVLEVLGA